MLKALHNDVVDYYQALVIQAVGFGLLEDWDAGRNFSDLWGIQTRAVMC